MRHHVALQLLAMLSLASCTVGAPPSPLVHPAAVGRPQLLGVNVPADGAGAAVVTELGASWVRLELVDDSDEGELAPAVATRLGATLDDYHARGVSVLLLVDYTSLGGNAGFGTGSPCGDWAGWRTAWLARIAGVARDFGARVDAWEIWNEPDQPRLACGTGEYNPGMPAAEYGLLLRDANHAIRAAGATAPIVTAGLDSGLVAYIQDAGAAVGGLFADGVSIHPYGVVPAAQWCPDPGEDLDCDWGTLGGKVDEYFAATQLPVWITEVGIKTTEMQHQADYVTAAYAAFASRGAEVEHVFWFCISDAMVAPFGLTDSDWMPKPAFAAYQALTGAGTDGGGGSATRTSQLHGTVQVGAERVENLTVTAWGQDDADLHATTTDALGIYQLTDLDPRSRYNVVVNARFDAAAPNGYVVLDSAHAYEVRDNVELVSGPDHWHGEDFALPQ